MQEGWGRMNAFNIMVTVGNSFPSQWLWTRSALFVHKIMSYTVAEYTNTGCRKQNVKTRKSCICKSSRTFTKPQGWTTSFTKRAETVPVSVWVHYFLLPYLCGHCHLPKPQEMSNWFTGKTAFSFYWAFPDAWQTGLCCSRKCILLNKHSCRQLNVYICSCVCVSEVKVCEQWGLWLQPSVIFKTTETTSYI